MCSFIAHALKMNLLSKLHLLSQGSIMPLPITLALSEILLILVFQISEVAWSLVVTLGFAGSSCNFLRKNRSSFIRESTPVSLRSSDSSSIAVRIYIFQVNIYSGTSQSGKSIKLISVYLSLRAFSLSEVWIFLKSVFLKRFMFRILSYDQ